MLSRCREITQAAVTLCGHSVCVCVFMCVRYALKARLASLELFPHSLNSNSPHQLFVVLSVTRIVCFTSLSVNPSVGIFDFESVV